jgi:hypothetical protein
VRGRAFDVGEEERDRPFRERRRHGPIMAHTSTRGFCGCLALRAALTQEV